MVTDEADDHQRLLADMASSDWSTALNGVRAAGTWLERAMPGDPTTEAVVEQMAALSAHSKWEIRRAVAHGAGHSSHIVFDAVLARLAVDDNARVRQAAEQAALRRRDARHAGALGKQHEERIRSVLDEVEVRFGIRGREAVRRAGEEIANIFARELYHEIVRLLTPLTLTVDRLHTQLGDTSPATGSAANEVRRIEEQIRHIRAVLDAMRAYTQLPRLEFTVEPLHNIAREAVALACPPGPDSTVPAIEIDIPATLTAEIARPRLIQALTNIVANAVESYRGTDATRPIRLTGLRQDGYVRMSVQDFGCGMSDEAVMDAPTLFATSKPGGTGFGLPLAIKIIESEHGGRLRLESELGRGTTVQLDLPAYRHWSPA